MIDLFYDLHQNRKIASAADSASQANQRATNAQYKIRRLEDAVDRLALVNMAM